MRDADGEEDTEEEVEVVEGARRMGVVRGRSGRRTEEEGDGPRRAEGDRERIEESAEFRRDGREETKGSCSVREMESDERETLGCEDGSRERRGGEEGGKERGIDAGGEEAIE